MRFFFIQGKNFRSKLTISLLLVTRPHRKQEGSFMKRNFCVYWLETNCH